MKWELFVSNNALLFTECLNTHDFIRQTQFKRNTGGGREGRVGDMNSGEGPEGNGKAPDAEDQGQEGTGRWLANSGQGGLLGSELPNPPSCQQSFPNGSV